MSDRFDEIKDGEELEMPEMKDFFEDTGEQPLVSVIIPCEEESEYLGEALESVLGQSYENKEIIVINYQNFKKNRSVVNEIKNDNPDENIELIEPDAADSMIDAKNSAAKISAGSYLLFLKPEDKLASEYLSETVDIMENNPAYGYVYTDVQYFGDSERIEKKDKLNPEKLLRSNIPGDCCLMRYELFGNCGGFSAAMFLGDEEWNLWITALKKKYKAGHVDMPLFMRRSENVKTYSKIEKNELKAVIVFHHPQLFTDQVKEQAKKIIADLSEDSLLKLKEAYNREPGNEILKEIYEAASVKKTKSPLVSVILPTYNRRELVQDSIKSVLDQSYRDFELIVVNDAGEDISDIIEELNSENKIRYFAHETNKGLSAARNTGMREAKGKYIACLDDDDIYYSEHLETLVEFLENNDYQAAYTDAYRVHKRKQGDEIIEGKKDIPYSNDFDYRMILVWNLLPVICMMHEKACTDDAGQFDENLSSHEDWDLWIRISRKYRIAHVKKVTCEFSWWEDKSGMTSGNLRDMFRTMNMVYDKTMHLVENYPELIDLRRKHIELYKVKLIESEKKEPKTEEKMEIAENKETMTKSKVSIVIPVFNNAEYTEKCLEEIYKLTPPELLHEIIVVDNGSTDRTPDLLESYKEKYRNFKYFSNPQNLGFGKACNQGMKLNTGDYVLLLNNDTIPLEGWLSALVQEAEKDEQIGIAGPLMLYPENQLIQHAGVKIAKIEGNIHAYHDYILRNLDNTPQIRESRDVQAVTGAAMLIKRDVIRKIGCLSEEYLNSFEDIDFCFSAAEAGFKIRYCASSILYHYESATPGRFGKVAENFSIFNKKWAEKIVPMGDLEDNNLGFLEHNLRLQLKQQPDNIELFGQLIEICRKRDDQAEVEALRKKIDSMRPEEKEQTEPEVSPETEPEQEPEKETESRQADEFSLFDFENEPEKDSEEETSVEPAASVGQPAEGADEKPYLNVVWEGSQFVYHSLALINREHCANIIDAGLVNLSIVPFEDEQFSEEGIPKYQKLREHDIRYKEEVPNDVGKLPYCWIRHQWPPDPNPPKGAKWIIMQPWEFSKLRKDFYEIFSTADEIWTPSTYSRQAMVDSGLDFDKVQVIPNGVDPELFKPWGNKYDLRTDKKLKFLYIGGAIHRKGIDVLLAAYTKKFGAEDDVCLVVKDMGCESFYERQGVTNREKIKEIREWSDSPEIIYIDEYLTEEEIASLYRACDVYVSPYRAEGFSLPTLEAMACGLPVVVTEGGAADDFVDEECGWKITAEPLHLGDELDNIPLMGDAEVLDPDLESLAEILIGVYNEPSILFGTGLKASAKARKNWTWKRSTMKVFTRLDHLYGTEMAKQAAETLADKDDGAIYAGMAESYFDNKNYEMAAANFEKALAEDSLEDNIRLHTLKRLILMTIENGEFDKAKDFLGQAENTAPGNVDLTYLKALLLQAQEKFLEAIEVLTPVLENWIEYKFESALGFGLDDLLAAMGEMLYGIEDHESAMKLFTSALKQNPQNAAACFGAAKCFRDAGADKEAREMFEWAVNLAPDMSEAAAELEKLGS